MNNSIENNNEQIIMEKVINYKHNNKIKREYVKAKHNILGSPFMMGVTGSVQGIEDNGYTSIIGYNCLGEDTTYYRINTSDLIKHFEVL